MGAESRHSTPHILFRKWIVARVLAITPKLALDVLRPLPGQSRRDHITLPRCSVLLIAARRLPRVLNIRRDPKTLVLVGIGSLALLQIADFTVGFWLRGITPTEQFAQLLTGQGNIYAALLALFAIMPWAANCWLGRLKLRGHDR
jgi:hypothetical protein